MQQMSVKTLAKRRKHDSEALSLQHDNKGFQHDNKGNKYINYMK